MPYALLALVLVILDQVVKYLVLTHIPLGGYVPFLPHVVCLTYVQNTGAAFSMFSQHTWILAFISLVMSVVLAVALWKNFFTHPLGKVTLSLLLAGAVAVFAAVFALYSLPVEAVAYAGLLCLMLGLVLFALGYSAFLRRHRELEGLLRKVHESVLPLPPPRGVLEADYQALLRAVCADRVRLAAENRDRLEDMTDYYTLWAHQIKTPIAAARLLLQEDPGAVGTEVEVELLKIEQYVDMVLGYLRLDSESTDYVLRDTDLDGLLRQAVRKFARMFILKKITLDFRETGRTVLTDGKWLSFVVEQVLSNALKYTPAGGRIRIYGDGETLVIADSGIGIRPEDLPRVFEKGFTGYNGREDKKSTGIGLYLCRRVMDRLNHGISIVSRPGQGTLVRLDLSRGRRVVE